MTMPPMADTARLIAKLLANRQTPQEEIPALIAGVHAALASLAAPPAAAQPGFEAAIDEEEAQDAVAAPTRTRRRRLARADRPVAEAAAEPAPAPPPPPRLLRRADVVSAAPAAPPADSLAPPRQTVRGVVKWFDARERKGALRLPGFSGDVTVDAAMLAAAGIGRLYKGQEIEATLNGTPEQPTVLKLALPGGTAPNLPSGGIVRGRHAKPVVVELKREALRRVAARAEAEQVLGPGRSR